MPPCGGSSPLRVDWLLFMIVLTVALLPFFVPLGPLAFFNIDGGPFRFRLISHVMLCL